MKLKEELTSFSQSLSNEFGKLGVMSKGLEGAIAVNDAMKSTANEEKNKKNMIKRPIKSGIATQLVGQTKMDKPIGKLVTLGKTESKEATGAGSAGGYVAPLFGEFKENKSAKKQFEKDILKDPEYIKKREESKIYDEKGNVVGSYGTPNVTREDPFVNKGKFKKIKIQDENQNKSRKEETKEATGAGSAGAYVTTAAWAPTMGKKDWIGKSKTQYPGGKFVQVKKKCKTFPYCNQGDIKALKLTENETVKKIISKISKEHNISENVIKTILAYEYEKYKLIK